MNFLAVRAFLQLQFAPISPPQNEIVSTAEPTEETWCKRPLKANVD